MAVEVCHDAWRQVATLYCNTSNTAFGPIFTGPAAGTEAEDFLDWMRDGYAIGHAPRLIGDGTDPRDYQADELARLVHRWREQYEPVIPEPQSLRVPTYEDCICIHGNAVTPGCPYCDPDVGDGREPDGYRLDGGRMIPTDR